MNIKKLTKKSRGFILPFIIIAIVMLAALAVGLNMAGLGVRMQAINTKSQTAAMLAAEAGYEKAIFWMGQQSDILGALQDAHSGASGEIDLGNSSCEYQVDFDDFIGAKPVFRITSTGTNGINSRVVDVQVMQEVTGWVMGKCRIPNGPTSTGPVNFVDGEILDIPIHINNLKDNPDAIDIYISGRPKFKQKVEMGEPRKVGGSGSDKYNSVMTLFEDGIYFDQPNVRITDSAAVQSKVNRFRDSTNPLYRFAPYGTANITKPRSAVQLEFFVEGGIGKVRITNHCTVRSYSGNIYDYNIVPNSNPATYQKYDIYAYHYAPDTLYVPPVTYKITDTYVTQHFGGKESAPGGQIYVNGDVIIGGDMTVPDPNMVVKGKMTVVATGNIWIADSIKVDDNAGTQRDVNGMPKEGNPNCLGLIARGSVKVIDPGLSNNSVSVGLPDPNVPDRLIPSHKHFYKPVAILDGSPVNNRKLPHNMVVEAAVTVGGGGWGAENVNSSGMRRKTTGPGTNDYLILHGTISECVRGVVGITSTNGYIKQYYLDKRLLEGILPGDIWFGGKYVPAPAGWHDYKAEE
jgi:hypothetical protein